MNQVILMKKIFKRYFKWIIYGFVIFFILKNGFAAIINASSFMDFLTQLFESRFDFVKCSGCILIAILAGFNYYYNKDKEAKMK